MKKNTHANLKKKNHFSYVFHHILRELYIYFALHLHFIGYKVLKKSKEKRDFYYFFKKQNNK